MSKQSKIPRRSPLESAFEWQLKASGLSYECEVGFDPKRRWRFDFVVGVSRLIAVEIEGGIYRNGRHTRGRGFEADCEKYNAAAIQGWRVLRGTAKHVRSGELLDWVKEALK